VSIRGSAEGEKLVSPPLKVVKTITSSSQTTNRHPEAISMLSWQDLSA